MDVDRYRFSPKHKPRLSLGFSYCFRRDNRGTLERKQHSIADSNSHSQPRLLRSATTGWARSRTDERCLALFCGTGKGRRRNSGDFKYDPLSYSLNFDEGSSHSDQSNEFPLRNFSARLLASPPVSPRSEERVTAAVVVPREISAFS